PPGTRPPVPGTRSPKLAPLDLAVPPCHERGHRRAQPIVRAHALVVEAEPARDLLDLIEVPADRLEVRLADGARVDPQPRLALESLERRLVAEVELGLGTVEDLEN